MKPVLLFMGSVLLLQGAQPSVEEARQFIAKGDYSRGAQALTAILRADPNNLDAHILLGNMLALQGRRAESIQELLKAVQLKPDSAVAYNALGMALSRFAEMKPAQDALENVVRLDPNFTGAHLNLALVLAQQGDLQGALDHLHRALEQNGPPSMMAYCHYLCAKVYSQQNRFDNAIAELETATRLQPDMLQAWISLGIARRAALDETGALQAFQRAADLDASNPEAQYLVGAAYLSTHSPHQAVLHLKKALQLQPGDKAILYHLARALRQDGQPEEAKRIESQIKPMIEQSERANETAIDATRLNNDAVELEKSGDVRGALEKYRQALDLNPSHDGFRLNYGLALCRLNRWDQGIAEIREVLRHNPDNADATRALYIALDKQKLAANRGNGLP